MGTKPYQFTRESSATKMRFSFRSVIDYFVDCDPLEFNFRLLIVNGFWPIETKNKTIQVLYSIYSFLCIFSVMSMLFIEILDIIIIRHDLVALSKNLCATSVSFATAVKHIFIFYKVENVMALHKRLSAFKESITEPEDVEIIKESDNMISKASRGLYGLGVPCISAWMLYPALDSFLEPDKPKGVPFPYRLPTDDWSTPVYEILYTYQSLAMIGFMIMVISDDLVYYGMVIRINTEYEILIKKLKALDDLVQLNKNTVNNNLHLSNELYEPAVTEKAMLIVKECCCLHQKILEEIDQLKMVYGNPYLIHFVSAILMVGSIIVDVIMVSKGIQIQMLQRVIYSATGIFDTYLCCLFTTLMQEQSYKLMRTVYSTPWYKLSPKVRKDLQMITIRSGKPPAVRVGNFFPLNLSTFLQFLKMTYNISALLYQTIKR